MLQWGVFSFAAQSAAVFCCYRFKHTDIDMYIQNYRSFKVMKRLSSHNCAFSVLLIST